MRRLDLLVLAGAIVLAIVWFLPGMLARFTVAKRTDLVPEEREFLLRARRVLGKDDILPVYNPRFVSAAEAGLKRDDLVLGVAIGGEAKAYPIAILNGREMVNDTVGGVPVLATW